MTAGGLHHAHPQSRAHEDLCEQSLARLRFRPTGHARRPFLARASRAPPTRRSLVPSRRKSLSETWLNCNSNTITHCLFCLYQTMKAPDWQDFRLSFRLSERGSRRRCAEDDGRVRNFDPIGSAFYRRLSRTAIAVAISDASHYAASLEAFLTPIIVPALNGARGSEVPADAPPAARAPVGSQRRSVESAISGSEAAARNVARVPE